MYKLVKNMKIIYSNLKRSRINFNIRFDSIGLLTNILSIISGYIKKEITRGVFIEFLSK